MYVRKMINFDPNNFPRVKYDPKRWSILRSSLMDLHFERKLQKKISKTTSIIHTLFHIQHIAYRRSISLNIKLLLCECNELFGGRHVRLNSFMSPKLLGPLDQSRCCFLPEKLDAGKRLDHRHWTQKSPTCKVEEAYVFSSEEP